MHYTPKDRLVAQAVQQDYLRTAAKQRLAAAVRTGRTQMSLLRWNEWRERLSGLVGLRSPQPANRNLRTLEGES